MGAILAKEAVAKHLTPGSHGTTFGGNPLAAAAANAVLDVLLAPSFLDQVAARGRVLRAGLEALAREVPAVFDGVRGLGLMLGMECAVLRLVPPLTVTDSDIAEGLARLRRAAMRCAAHVSPMAAK
jgi:acetylornithine/N-succinyldiaminopimelate aminotransferase